MVPFPYHQGKRCNNGNANPVSCDCERVIFFVNGLAHTLTIPHERAEPMDRTIPVIWAPPVKSPPTIQAAPTAAHTMQMIFFAVICSWSSKTAKKQIKIGFMQLISEEIAAPHNFVPNCCRLTEITYAPSPNSTTYFPSFASIGLILPYPFFLWIAKSESITTAAMQYLRQSKVKPGIVSSSILLQT